MTYAIKIEISYMEEALNGLLRININIEYSDAWMGEGHSSKIRTLLTKSFDISTE